MFNPPSFVYFPITLSIFQPPLSLSHSSWCIFPSHFIYLSNPHYLFVQHTFFVYFSFPLSIFQPPLSFPLPLGLFSTPLYLFILPALSIYPTPFLCLLPNPILYFPTTFIFSHSPWSTPFIYLSNPLPLSTSQSSIYFTTPSFSIALGLFSTPLYLFVQPPSFVFSPIFWFFFHLFFTLYFRLPNFADIFQSTPSTNMTLAFSQRSAPRPNPTPQHSIRRVPLQ